jgi:hypothetical protein
VSCRRRSFAIHLPQQPLDRYAAVQTALSQPLEDGAHDPPELEHGLACRRRFDLLGDLRHCGELVIDVVPADPAK